MENKIKATVKLIEVLAPIISSRDLIENLGKLLLKTKAELIELDFSDVEFISRSAAHAILLMKEDLKRKIFHKKDLSFINANDEIKKMLRIVAANRAMPHSATTFKAKNISIDTLLKGDPSYGC